MHNSSKIRSFIVQNDGTMDKLERIKAKIIPATRWELLDAHLAFWQFKQLKIGFTNGCFDILHQGHVAYLAQAASHSDIFVVGLNSDASVRRLKGAQRPLQDESSRAMVLAALGFVDGVVLFEQDTPNDLIRYLMPDVLAKGADYTKEQVVGADIVEAGGGQVKLIDLVEGYSTTAVINRMK
jgi:D-beta-D-heptose 7-phosphate kinase/D-beta-D-heptose 1-phosphate adenosyltransferase